MIETPFLKKCSGLYLTLLFLVVLVSTWIPLVPIFSFSMLCHFLPYPIRRMCFFCIGYITSIFHRAVLFAFEKIIGTKFIIYGNIESFPKNENTLIISNHPTRTDWIFLFVLLLKTGNLHNVKFVLKDDVRFIPFLGWICQFTGYLFLSRNWSDDAHVMAAIIDFWRRHTSSISLILFPEGTDKTKNSLAKSHQFSEKNNLPKWDQVLVPRETGFLHILSEMTQSGENVSSNISKRCIIDAVYDVTIAYSPAHIQNEYSLLQGKLPEYVHIDCKRYSLDDLPLNSDKDLKSWIYTRFEEKEKTLSHFFQSKKYNTSRIANGLPPLHDGSELVEDIAVKESSPYKLPSDVPLLADYIGCYSPEDKALQLQLTIHGIISHIIPILLLYFFLYLPPISLYVKIPFVILSIAIPVYYLTVKQFSFTKYIANTYMPTAFSDFEPYKLSSKSE